jgi:hypothetical protein
MTRLPARSLTLVALGSALILAAGPNPPTEAALPRVAPRGAATHDQQLSTTDPAGVTKAQADDLAAHHQSAEDYLVSRFKTHDVVFLGESHVTRERELFLQRLIPLLYKAGVRTLGYEMGCSEDQAAIDTLVNAPTWDEAAAFTILAHWDFSWPFQEYADVYRAAWELNHGLPNGAPRFRILGIDIRPDYRRVPAGANPMIAFRPLLDPKAAETLRGIIVGGPDRDLTRNTRMAEILRREVLTKGQKALMFNGSGHSTTKYLRPNRAGVGERRMVVGYMIHQEIGDRAMGVLLGGPGTLLGGASEAGKDPILNAVAGSLPPARDGAGFDTKGSPIGGLTVTVGKLDTLKMEEFWDGLAFVSMKTPWEPSTANFKYLTEERVKLAKAEGNIPDRPEITVDSLKKDVQESRARVVEQIKKNGAY